MTLTEAEQKVLDLLRAFSTPATVRELHVSAEGLTARQVAYVLWPNSPGWTKRTRMHGGRNGAVGGAMPLAAGRILSRLSSMALIERVGDSNRWRLR